MLLLLSRWNHALTHLSWPLDKHNTDPPSQSKENGVESAYSDSVFVSTLSVQQYFYL